MSAANYDFKIEQGSSFTLSLVYKNSSKVPVNLTNYCAKLIWTSSAGTSTFTTDHSGNDYRFYIDEINGKLILQFPANTTNSFNFYNAKYDLYLQSPDELYIGGGKYTTRILYGSITIIKRHSLTNNNIECNL